MRGRTKAVTIAIALSVMFISSIVFASGILDFSKLALYSGMPFITPDSPGTPNVFVSPRWYVKDYALQPIGSTFTVHVNITEATDLYTWQINITWNKAVLNVSRIIANEFLARSASPTSSEQLGGIVVNSTKNSLGTSAFGESLLGAATGVTAAPPGGRLVSVQFKVVGYGKTNLSIVVTGAMATTLLDSLGATTVFTSTNGYFDNRILGDITGPENPPGSGLYPYDRKVDGYDLIYLGKKFGTTDPVADFTGPENPVGSGFYPPDGTVDGRDLIALGKNFGRIV